MVGGLKILTVTLGREMEFEALFAELRNEMHTHEPGCLLYSLLKSRTSSSDYIVHEQYVDQAALDFHSRSAHGAHYFPRMRALFDKIDVRRRGQLNDSKFSDQISRCVAGSWLIWLFGLSHLCGSTNERDKTDPRT